MCISRKLIRPACARFLWYEGRADRREDYHSMFMFDLQSKNKPNEAPSAANMLSVSNKNMQNTTQQLEVCNAYPLGGNTIMCNDVI